MTNPITPPPDLVQQWAKDRALLGDDTQLHIYIATRAAQWGADQELEACLRYAGDNGLSITRMRAARRPKPPSLKEQALAALEDDDIDVYLIRRALEALDD